MKHSLRSYEAARCAVKRSALKSPRVPKARFIGRSPASRVASQLASCASARFIEKSTCLRKCFFLAGVAGFGPANAGVKVLCLTAWRYPNDLTLIFYHIIPQLSRGELRKGGIKLFEGRGIARFCAKNCLQTIFYTQNFFRLLAVICKTNRLMTSAQK